MKDKKIKRIVIIEKNIEKENDGKRKKKVECMRERSKKITLNSNNLKENKTTQRNEKGKHNLMEKINNCHELWHNEC